MTNGPYCTTGSPIGLPDSSSNRAPLATRPNRHLRAGRQQSCGAERQRARILAHDRIAFVHVEHRVVVGGRRDRHGHPGRQSHVVIQRLRRKPGDRSRRADAVLLEVARDDADLAAACERNRRDLRRRNIAIRRGLHLFARRQVDPELEAAHAPRGLLRHLRMDDAVCRRHPLHVARAEVARVAEAVLVPHVAVEHVGDGLEAAVRMRRKAGDVVVRVVREELVEHQERIEPLVLPAAERAAQLDPRAVRRRDRFDDRLQFA